MIRLLLLIGIFFTACVEVYNIPSRPQEAYIQATRKTEVINGEKVELVLIATHLNAVNAEVYNKENGEYFFVDIYHTDKKRDFFNNYTLSLNGGAKPLKITKLQKEQLNGEMLNNATRWGEYYIIEFKAQEKRVQNTLQLILSTKDNAKISHLNFGFKPLSKEDLRKNNANVTP